MIIQDISDNKSFIYHPPSVKRAKQIRTIGIIVFMLSFFVCINSRTSDPTPAFVIAFLYFIVSIFFRLGALNIDNNTDKWFDDTLSKHFNRNMKYANCTALITRDANINFFFPNDGTYSGIAYDGKYIYIVKDINQKKQLFTLGWDDVRSWGVNILGTTEIYGEVDLSANIQVASANARARGDSGFTITTSNVEYPTLLFSCTNQNVTNKWYEIFNQIKEKRLPISEKALP